MDNSATYALLFEDIEKRQFVVYTNKLPRDIDEGWDGDWSAFPQRWFDIGGDISQKMHVQPGTGRIMRFNNDRQHFTPVSNPSSGSTPLAASTITSTPVNAENGGKKALIEQKADPVTDIVAAIFGTAFVLFLGAVALRLRGPSRVRKAQTETDQIALTSSLLPTNGPQTEGIRGATEVFTDPSKNGTQFVDNITLIPLKASIRILESDEERDQADPVRPLFQLRGNPTFLIARPVNGENQIANFIALHSRTISRATDRQGTINFDATTGTFSLTNLAGDHMDRLARIDPIRLNDRAMTVGQTLPLHHQDVLTIGRVKMRFEDPSEDSGQEISIQ